MAQLVGLLVSSDGVSFHRPASTAPVLTPADVALPDLWSGVDLLASPFAESYVTVDGDVAERLYFAARGRESGASQQFAEHLPETFGRLRRIAEPDR